MIEQARHPQFEALRALAELIYQEAGVFCKPEKYYLIENRLSRRLRVTGCESLIDYYELIQRDKEERNSFVSTMTTHTTYFFREFEQIRDVCQRLGHSNEDVIHILSAACSTGQEAYSVAALLEHKRSQGGPDYRILGVDVCESSVQQANNGVYAIDQGENILKEGFRKYFEKSGNLIRQLKRLEDAVSFSIEVFLIWSFQNRCASISF